MSAWPGLRIVSALLSAVLEMNGAQSRSHLELFALESVQWLIFFNILFLSKTLSNTLFRGVNCFNILLLYYSE